MNIVFIPSAIGAHSRIEHYLERSPKEMSGIGDSGHEFRQRSSAGGGPPGGTKTRANTKHNLLFLFGSAQITFAPSADADGGRATPKNKCPALLFCTSILVFALRKIAVLFFFLILALLPLSSCSIVSFNAAPASQLDVEVKNAVRMPFDPEVERRSEAMHRYLVGQLSYAEEDFKTAMSNFSKASGLIGDSEPELHSKLAELYIRSGELEKALEESKKALAPNPNDPQKLLLHAGILESLRHSDEAEATYRKVIQNKADLVESYVLLAALYVKTERLDKATEILRSLISKAPSEALGYYYMSRALELKGDLKGAELNLKTAYEKNRANAEVAMDYTRILLKNNNQNEAKKVCEEVLERDPQNVLARRVIGQLMIGENKLDQALNHLKALEDLEEDPAETRFKVALIQIQRQQYKEAMAELSLVLAQNPQHGQARYYLATVYAASGSLKEALQELFKVDSDSEMFAKSRMFAAFVARQAGDLETAERAVRQALKKEPDNKAMLSYLVLLLRESGDLDGAKDILTDMLEVDPKNDRILFQYAVLLHDLDQEQDALKTMQHVIEINPKNSDALNYIAYALVEEGRDLGRAKALIDQALQIKPNDGFYLDTLGWLHYKRGDYSSAEAILAQAVGSTDGDLVISEHYADCLVKLGKSEKAIEIYERSLQRDSKLITAADKEVIQRINHKLRELRATLSDSTRKN